MSAYTPMSHTIYENFVLENKLEDLLIYSP